MMAWATKSFHFKEFGETKWLEHQKSNLSTFLIQSILIMNLLCWIKGVLLLIINLDYIYCDSMWWNSETCKSPKGTVNTFYRHCGVLSVHSNNIISTLWGTKLTSSLQYDDVCVTQDIRLVRMDVIGLQSEWQMSCEVKEDWNRTGEIDQKKCQRLQCRK